MVFFLSDPCLLYQVMKPINDRVNIPGTELYDPTMCERMLFYWDANNLYGTLMCECLPVGYHEWILNAALRAAYQGQVLPANERDYARKEFRKGVDNVKEIERMLMLIPDDGPKGYILEVDLDYPDHLHDLHNAYPLAPVSKFVRPSPYTLREAEKIGMKYGKSHKSTVKKLVLDLTNKRNYVVHYRNLKFYIQQGMVLKKVHRIMSFSQAPWLKSYVMFNTLMRSQAKNSIDKDFFKLMINSIFGKTMESVWKHMKVDFCVGEKDRNKAHKSLRDPFMKQFRILVPDQLIAIEKRHHYVTLNRPILIGMAILDLSKLHMYKFHYEVMMPAFGEQQAQMIYTDTDSLVYQLEGDNFLDRDLPPTCVHGGVFDMLRQVQYQHRCFDLSVLKEDHPLRLPLPNGDPMPLEKGVLGRMKDEMKGVNGTEWIGLRAKMYSLELEWGYHMDDKGKPFPSYAKRKGVPGSVRLLHKHYRKVHESGRLIHRKFSMIDHLSHKQGGMELVTRKQKKIVLSSVDDKSFYLSKTFCVRYGHYQIPRLVALEPDRLKGVRNTTDGEEPEQDLLNSLATDSQGQLESYIHDFHDEMFNQEDARDGYEEGLQIDWHMYASLDDDSNVSYDPESIMFIAKE